MRTVLRAISSPGSGLPPCAGFCVEQRSRKLCRPGKDTVRGAEAGGWEGPVLIPGRWWGLSAIGLEQFREKQQEPGKQKLNSVHSRLGRRNSGALVHPHGSWVSGDMCQGWGGPLAPGHCAEGGTLVSGAARALLFGFLSSHWGCVGCVEEGEVAQGPRRPALEACEPLSPCSREHLPGSEPAMAPAALRLLPFHLEEGGSSPAL